MLEVKYKFKSSLTFETLQFSEPKITVGAFKELINKKHSLKTNGFDLTFKDSNGNVYRGDDEIIDVNFNIIVSRSPKLSKPPTNVPKKERVVINKDVIHSANPTVVPLEDIIKKNDVCKVNDAEKSISPECLTVLSAPNTTIIPITPDFLKCTLCHNIMKEATIINCCKKNFCYECITGYLFDPDISGSMECPECKSTVSNYAANVTHNTKLRAMIADFETGKIDAVTASDLREVSDSNGSVLDKEMESEHIKSESSSVHNESSQIKCEESVQDVNVDIDGNLYNDNLLNQISVTEAFEYQIQSYPSETETRTLPETKVTTVVVSDCKPPSDTINIYGDQLSTEEESPITQNYHSNNIVQEDDNHVMPDAQMQTCAKNTVNQSIKDLEFDAVLYMKFLKIVGENYPDELKKILSNNIEPISHTTKDNEDCKKTSRHRSREEDYHENNNPLKKCRRDDDSSDTSRYKKKTYAEPDKRVDDSRRYEDTGRRNNSNHHSNNTTLVNATTGHSSGNTNRQSDNRSQRPKEQQYMRRSNGVQGSGQSSSVVVVGGGGGGGGGGAMARGSSGRRYKSRSRSRDHMDVRSRDQYHRGGGSRYGRQQDGPPPSFSDDRRRFKNDYPPAQSSSSTSYRDNQKYDRRSDR